jgi:transposase
MTGADLRPRQIPRWEEAGPLGLPERWVVERIFAWLGGFRRLLVRWERRAHIYLAFLLLACILILLRVISG